MHSLRKLRGCRDEQKGCDGSMKFLNVFEHLKIGDSYIRVVRRDFELELKRIFFYVQMCLYSVVLGVLITQHSSILLGMMTSAFVIAQLWTYRFLYLPIEEEKVLDLSVEDDVLVYRDGSQTMIFPLEKIREVREDSKVILRNGSPCRCSTILMTVEREYAMGQPVLNHILPVEQGRFVLLSIDTLELSHEDHEKLYAALKDMVGRSREFVPYPSPFEDSRMWTR